MIIEYNGGNINPDALLYFYAAWSSKCNLHINALKKLESEDKDLLIVRVNVTKFNILKQTYGITKIPTFIMVKNGEILSRMNGYSDIYTLSRWIKKIRS